MMDEKMAFWLKTMAQENPVTSILRVQKMLCDGLNTIVSTGKLEDGLPPVEEAATILAIWVAAAKEVKNHAD